MAQINKGYLYQNKKVLFCLRILDPLLYLLPKKKRPLPREIKKIALIKPDNIGDMLLLTSIVPLIHDKYPQAVIDIVGNKWNLSILENNPHVRNRYVVNHYTHNRDKISKLGKKWLFLKSYFTAIQKMKNQEYDLCLVMRAFGNNLISFTKFMKCHYSIGHGTGGLGALLDEVVQWKEGVHEAEHFLEVLRPLGISAVLKDLRYELYPSHLTMKKIDGIWNKLFTRGERVAIVHPGSGNPQKTLSDDQWRSCIGLLEDKGYHVVITGSADEKPLAEKIASPNCTILCGMFDAIELACFFRKALLIVTVDTLSAHLGEWSGTRTIAFYGGINDTRQWRPFGENVVVVERFCDRAPCFTGCEEKKCMDFDFSEILFSKIIPKSSENSFTKGK